MTPPTESDGSSLERFREYLHLLARLQLDARFRGKLDVSGVVQQTLLEAHQARERLQDQSDDQKAAWLRKILSNNLADEIRKLRRQKHDVRRECSLEKTLEDSAARLGDWLAAQQSSPSRRAQRQEQTTLLLRVLAELPEAQREAVVRHHLQQQPLSEIAQHLGRSPLAVAGLLHRGLKKLRELLGEAE
jgi:RNA polymerase sigma-70 factor (ECF subfamily)